ncbi:hypothetical protein Glove_41g167 [Diversispora epigaea]|uniref:Uncharacterized protein n=1 Tax=Diversispora epigaea TaxID=1348612 RepID=A0A397JPD5_9GLOM|nr:hypothetical protein Glove_41g167 [Diversispora epigaea]
MFVEQILNADLTQCIPWQQIKGNPSKGVQPKWYNEVVKEVNKKRNELQFSGATNPFNTLRWLDESEIKRYQTITTKNEADLIYGIVSRIPKKKNPSLLVM